MQEAAVDIKTEDGTMNSYSFRPDGDGIAFQGCLSEQLRGHHCR